MGMYYEFFAGGGMARAGLGSGWTCLFANDFDAKKAASYALNWGSDHLKIGDVAAVTTAELPGSADLAWASFPCQDLSLAGAGAGLKGERSGTFWPFWKLMKKLGEESRAPRLIVLENVCGALTSHGGKDFAAIGAALSGAGYRYGAVVMDAVDFVPQSRPRLFIIGVHKSQPIPQRVIAPAPDPDWHSPALIEAYDGLAKRCREAWIWWQLPAPPVRNTVFADLVEESPQGVAWHTREQTRKLLDMMSQVNRAKVTAAKKAGRRMVGAIYRRTRLDECGKVQRAEIRFDDIAGCLRTPAGGSSRQVLMLVDGAKVRSRLLSPREAARLMGLPDDYRLPENYNEAYHLAGDGVAVPVVRFLAANLLEPILSVGDAAEKEAA
ncbi:DNA cytosine methyltransferase [Methylocystis sp. IM2]|uniref:DNA cytosine methyltransferase n=2 Tax=unclassified Methylocystis TaxID=2625913 RepID=UPI0030F66679